MPDCRGGGSLYGAGGVFIEVGQGRLQVTGRVATDLMTFNLQFSAFTE